jgi:hypothetical protein
MTINNQQKRRSKNVIIWRDNVVADDNCSTPHQKKMKVENDETIESVMEKNFAAHYIPDIQRGRAHG